MEEQKEPLKDRNGKVITVIARNRNSMRPAKTDRNLSRENSRRLRQKGEQPRPIQSLTIQGA